MRPFENTPGTSWVRQNSNKEKNATAWLKIDSSHSIRIQQICNDIFWLLNRLNILPALTLKSLQLSHRI
jgi:hypothetical protein